MENIDQSQTLREGHMCNDCGKIFPSLNRLEAHLLAIHHGPQLSRKEQTPGPFLSQVYTVIEDMVRQDPSSGQMCMYCGEIYLNLKFLGTHQLNIHPQSETVEEYMVQSETPTGWWMCTTCGVDFPTLEILQTHQLGFTHLDFQLSRKEQGASQSHTVREDIIQSKTPDPYKEELSNPRSEMVEPDASLSGGTQRPVRCSLCKYVIGGERMGMGGLCKYCKLIFPTLEILETHTRDVHRHDAEWHNLQTAKSKEELSNPRSEMVDPDASQSTCLKTYLCYFCNSFIESRSAYKEHIVSKHREESGMQKPSPCFRCNMVFESTLGCGEHMMTVHLKDMTDDNERIWEAEKKRNNEIRKQAYESYAAAAQSFSNQEIVPPPREKYSSLDGLRHLTVDDLAKLELSDLAYIRYGSVPCTRNDRDIVPIEEIIALEATHVFYGSVIEAGVCGKSPYTREVILCRTCGSRMIKDSALRDICLKGCPPGCASMSFLVGPDVKIHYPRPL